MAHRGFLGSELTSTHVAWLFRGLANGLLDDAESESLMPPDLVAPEVANGAAHSSRNAGQGLTIPASCSSAVNASVARSAMSAPRAVSTSPR